MKPISSKGETVQGALRSTLRYPPGDPDVEPVLKFDTEVPTFANEEELSKLLEENGVVVILAALMQARRQLSARDGRLVVTSEDGAIRAAAEQAGLEVVEGQRNE